MKKYYSGQGIFSVAEKDASGNPLGFTEIGNVPEATIDIEVEKEEHKESQSGQRAVDLTTIKSKKGRLSMTVENFESSVLALGLHGTSSVIAAASITDEVVVMKHDKPVPTYMAKWSTPNNIVVKSNDGLVTYVLDTDYTLDADWGMITALSTGAITDLEACKVSYDHESTVNLEVFESPAPERWVRFHGVNTADSLAKKVVDIYKVSFDPVTGYSLISDDIQGMELNGDILYDDTRPDNRSKFMREQDIDAPTA